MTGPAASGSETWGAGDLVETSGILYDKKAKRNFKEMKIKYMLPLCSV